MLDRRYNVVGALKSKVLPPLTPMRKDRYRFQSSFTPVELHALAQSEPGRPELDLKIARFDAVDSTLRIEFTHGAGARWRWPPLIARCSAHPKADESCVDIEIQMSTGDYMIGWIATLVGTAFFYGLVSRNVLTAGILACTGVIWMHIQVLVNRQFPDSLAGLIAEHLQLRPEDIQEAKR